MAGCLVLAVVIGWQQPGNQIDNNAYDWMFRLHPPQVRKIQSALLVFDDLTLNKLGGLSGMRSTLADGLDRVATVRPRAVVMDITLPSAENEEADKKLEAAFRKISNLVLPCDMIPGGWQEPLERFRKATAAVGHVHADPDRLDSVTRQIPLQKVFDKQRRWSLAFEAFRLSLGGGDVIESPRELQVGGRTIPLDADPTRPLRIRYLAPAADGRSQIPIVTFQELHEHPDLVQKFVGKVVFVGITSQSTARDRLMTPLSAGLPMAGVEIHAQAFETLANGEFLTTAPDYQMVLFCIALVVAAGVIFNWLSGWLAYSLGALLLAIAHILPYWLFTHDIVFPYFAPAASAWLAVAVAASYQHFIVRRQLVKAEMDKARYKQAIHFVTHEMRTPLTAIQGSSELMTRYNLNDEKRKQIANMINSESKRLARMISNFLDVERLNEGQLELKKTDFELRDLVNTCVERALPLAERKQIHIDLESMDAVILSGDRELMEYAFYNILTNAVKYSPPETVVTLSGRNESGQLRLAVQDQGIGMDEKELKSIFQKFYRTKKAESSGEMGTGIGLSIVEQIVNLHKGRIEVTSAPGKGSCFTLVLPTAVRA